MAIIESNHGALKIRYEVDPNAIHQVEDGSWLMWAEEIDRRMDDSPASTPAIEGGVHIRRRTKEGLMDIIRRGAL